MIFRKKPQNILWLGFAFRWRAGDFRGELWDIGGSQVVHDWIIRDNLV